MNTSLTKLLVLAIFPFIGICQTGNGNKPSNNQASSGVVFLENEGQVINTHGLVANEVRYFSLFGNVTTFVCDNAISYVLTNMPKELEDLPDTLQRIDVSFQNEAQTISTFDQITPKMPFHGTFNFIKSSDNTMWQTQRTGYTGLFIREVVPGIDVDLKGSSRAIQCHITCKKGMDVSTLTMNITGANNVQINSQGALVIGTQFGNMVQSVGQPLFINPGGQKVAAPFAVKFLQISSTKIGFQIVGKNPGNRPFLIPIGFQNQPILSQSAIDGIEWSTFFPGERNEAMNDIQADDLNNVYLTGLTNSTFFPVTDGLLIPYQDTLTGGLDVVVSKFDENNVLQWMTFFGGIRSETGQAMTYTGDKKLYITGQTESSDFPVFKPQPGAAFQQTSYGAPNALQSAFIARFDPQTGIPDWSTAFAYGNDMVGTGIDYDNDNNVYIGGVASLTVNTCLEQCGDNPTQCFPVCNNAGFDYYQDFWAQGDAFCVEGLASDGFIAGFNPDGALQYSSFFGGGQDDIIRDLVIDRPNNLLYVTGFTESDVPSDNPCGVASSTYPSGFPLCNSGASAYYDDDFDGDFNRNCGFGDISNGQAFLSRIDLTDGSLDWSTFFGGNNVDVGNSIAINSSGDVYLVGSTQSFYNGFPLCDVPNNKGFPVCQTGSEYHESFKGIRDHYIARFSSSGELLWSTYLGGDKDETATELTGDPSVAIDAKDFVYVTGATNSNGNTFPLARQTGLYYQSSNADGALQYADAYIVAFNEGNEHIWGTLFGGSGKRVNVDNRADHGIRALVSPNQHLYIVGTSASNRDFPTDCIAPEFCYRLATIVSGENPNQPSTASDLDGFIAKFDISNIVGVEQRVIEHTGIKVAAFPIPAQGNLNISIILESREEITLKMINVLGQSEWIKTVTPRTLHHLERIDCHKFPNGLYFLEVQQGSSIVSQKLLLQ